MSGTAPKAPEAAKPMKLRATPAMVTELVLLKSKGICYFKWENLNTYWSAGKIVLLKT
jgi:hypothetical protein